MAWTDPNLVNWDVGDALTSADMKTYVRDNLLALKQPPSHAYASATDYTTTATAAVAVDATNMNHTISLEAQSDVLIHFNAMVKMSASAWLYFNLRRNGAILISPFRYQTASWGMVSMSYLCKDLAAGDHTFDIQWYVSAATGTISGGRNQFVVRQVN